eukprot:COSAG06_NODE_1206_length_10270_cov_8.055255_1_plen_25_part_10
MKVGCIRRVMCRSMCHHQSGRRHRR